MLIKLFDDFVIKIIGSPGKKLLTSMFLEYYDAKVLEEVKNLTPSLVIFIGKDVKNEVQNYKNVPFLISILSKKDYEFISNFCKENNLRMYIAPAKKIFSYYKYLNLPIFDYIHLSLAISASALRSKRDLNLNQEQVTIVNVEKELLSVDPHKPFHIRSSQIKKDSVNIDLVWEPGTKSIGNKLLMEWIRNSKINEDVDFYTIIDIDEIYETQDMKEYLLPFTTLGIYQKGILIVNTENLESEDNLIPFDYHIYTNIMELWNNKHYIPKRLSSLESVNEVFSSKNTNFNPQYELSIKKPPIFILDNFDSIYDFVYKLSKNSMILYIGKEDNYKKLTKTF